MEKNNDCVTPAQLSQNLSEWVPQIHSKKKKVLQAIVMFNQGWDLVMKGYIELKWRPTIVLVIFVFFSPKK